MVDGVSPIESIRVGSRVRTLREGEGLDQARVPASEIDPSTWRLAQLVVAEGTEHQVDVELLRSSDWLELHGIAAGEAVELYLPEMGVKGPAFVRSVEACPAIAEGDDADSRVVTATFRARLGVPWTLRVDGVEEPIRVTGDHHVWSEDRLAWVRVDELEPGENRCALLP